MFSPCERPVVCPCVCPMPASLRWPKAISAGRHSPQVGESIPVQKWNSLQGGQVHYTDAAAVVSNDRGRSSAL